MTFTKPITIRGIDLRVDDKLLWMDGQYVTIDSCWEEGLRVRYTGMVSNGKRIDTSMRADLPIGVVRHVG